MIIIGRILTSIAALGFLALIGCALRGECSAGTVGATLRVMTTVGAGAAFLGWILALFHWGTRYRGSSAAKNRWAIALTLGAVIGGWFYWIFADLRPRRTE